MSYAKWQKSVPDVDNVYTFFSVKHDNDDTVSWHEFYTAVRDPAWPDCDTYGDVKYLPKKIQEEIYQIYQQPVAFEVTDARTLLEFLSLSYFDMWIRPVQPMFKDTLFYPLSSYVANATQDLQEKIIEHLPHWSWDDDRSNKFHAAAMAKNQPYFAWLENLQEIVNDTINFQVRSTSNFLNWEKAAIIAKSCHLLGINPRLIEWQSSGCFLQEDNLTLVNFLKRHNNHG
jgi:hypothetical protein